MKGLTIAPVAKKAWVNIDQAGAGTRVLLERGGGAPFVASRTRNHLRLIYPSFAVFTDPKVAE